MARRNLNKGLTFNKTHKEFEVQKFGQLIEDSYLKDNREPTDKAKKSFAPSGLGWGSGRCPRYWYYAFNGGIMRVDDNDALGIANMAYGTEAHKRLGQLFKKADILIAEEIKLTHNDPPIFGFVDVLVRWQGEAVVGEIKTAKQESFIFRKTTMRPPGYHLVQLLIYMKVLGKDKGFFLYENKNTQELLVIPVYWTEENEKLIEKIFDWMRQTWKAFQEDQLPERPFTKRSKHCKECPFFEHCWADEREPNTKILPLELPK